MKQLNPSNKKLTTIRAEHLLTFCEVARAGSLSDAATRLGVTQPAVSRQLGQLQKAVGYALYTRSAYGVTLTAAGRDLLPYACAVAQTVTQARAYLAGTSSSQKVTLRVGLSHHLVTRYTGTLLKTVKTHNLAAETLNLHLVEGYSDDLSAQTAQRQLDAAIVMTAPQAVPEPLHASSIGQDQIGFLTLPDDPIGKKKYCSLADIAGEALIISSSTSSVYRAVTDRLARSGISPGRLIEVSGPAAVRTAVMAGQGVGVTLSSFTAPEVEAGWLSCCLIQDESFKVHVTLVMADRATLTLDKRLALDVIYNGLTA